MSSSFSSGTAVVQPLVIDGWSSSRSARTVVQPVIGGGADAVLYPAAPRSGTLSAVFLTLAAALQLEAMLAAAATITFADSDNPSLGMTFVAVNDITVDRGDEPVLLDDGTETFAWSVSFGFQQVTP